jgi:hypothetical protein
MKLEDFPDLPHAEGASQLMRIVSTGIMRINNGEQGEALYSDKRMALYAKDSNCFKAEGCLLVMPEDEANKTMLAAKLYLVPVKCILNYTPDSI